MINILLRISLWYEFKSKIIVVIYSIIIIFLIIRYSIIIIIIYSIDIEFVIILFIDIKFNSNNINNKKLLILFSFLLYKENKDRIYCNVRANFSKINKLPNKICIKFDTFEKFALTLR
jgi:hypothetical protein